MNIINRDTYENNFFTHRNCFANPQFYQNENLYSFGSPQKSIKKACSKRSPLYNRCNLSPASYYYDPYLQCNSFAMNYPHTELYQSQKSCKKKSKSSVTKSKKKCNFSAKCPKEQKNDIENYDKEIKSYKKRKKEPKITDVNTQKPPNANTNHVHKQSAYFNEQNKNVYKNPSSLYDESPGKYQTYDYCENNFSFSPRSSPCREMIDNIMPNCDPFNEECSSCDYSDIDVFDRSPINNFNLSKTLYEEVPPEKYFFKDYVEPTSPYYFSEYSEDCAAKSACETCVETKNEKRKGESLRLETSSQASYTLPCQYAVYLSTTPPSSPSYKTFKSRTSPNLIKTPLKKFPTACKSPSPPQYCTGTSHPCNEFLRNSPINSLLQPNSEFIKCLNIIIRKHVKRQVTRHVTNTIGSGFLKNDSHSPIPLGTNLISATDSRTGNLRILKISIEYIS